MDIDGSYYGRPWILGRSWTCVEITRGTLLLSIVLQKQDCVYKQSRDCEYYSATFVHCTYLAQSQCLHSGQRGSIQSLVGVRIPFPSWIHIFQRIAWTSFNIFTNVVFMFIASSRAIIISSVESSNLTLNQRVLLIYINCLKVLVWKQKVDLALL